MTNIFIHYVIEGYLKELQIVHFLIFLAMDASYYIRIFRNMVINFRKT